jgi:hypothetical protein
MFVILEQALSAHQFFTQYSKFSLKFDIIKNWCAEKSRIKAIKSYR